MAESQGSEIKEVKEDLQSQPKVQPTTAFLFQQQEKNLHVKQSTSPDCLKRLLKRSRDFVSPSYVMKDVPQRHLFHIAFVR